MVKAGQLFVSSKFLSPHSSLIARHASARFMVCLSRTNGEIPGNGEIPE